MRERSPFVSCAFAALLGGAVVLSSSLSLPQLAAAKDSAAEAQAKALEALKKQQQAILEAQKRALAAQKAAQEAAARAAQQRAAQIAAQQAAAQKAAQQAAAQKAAQQAAAQKAAQQAAAQKAAQQAAAQKAAQQAAAQKSAQQQSQQQASKPATPAPPLPAAPQVPSNAQPSTPVPLQTAVTEPSRSDVDLPNAFAGEGVPQFGSREFLDVNRDRPDGPARPDWAPDPNLLKVPKVSSSIKHPEPAEELAKELKIKRQAEREKSPPPAAAPGASAPVTPAPVAQHVKTPSRPSDIGVPVARPARPSEELLATGLSDKQVQVLTSLGVETQAVTLPSTGLPVQRIRVPTGMSADQFKATLTKQMPLTPFVPNHSFIIFGGAAGDAPKEDVVAQGSCAGDQCFGAELVHWSRSLNECTRDVKVGIIDTSFDTTHPAFRSINASHGVFLNGEQPSPLDWHGTAVLSELAGHPESGTPGLIPHAHFFLAAAFRTDESGNASTDTVRLLSALEWLEALGVQYVNMSFTGPRDELIEAAIRRMSKKGIVFIAAAGNQGPNAPPSFPAAYPEVVAVTAINRKGESYRSANRGSYIDVAAPGVEIPAALPNGKQGLRTGTSFAAPFVTAILAARSPVIPADGKGDVLTSLKIADLGPPGRDPIYGAGLALAPERCGAGPSGTVASRSPSPQPVEPAAATMFTPTLGGFAPAGGGFSFKQ